MTIKTKDPEVPRALPAARLYLDDIEQIVHILSDVECKVANAAPGTPQPQPTFRVGNKETHEIEDLPKIAKRTSDLTIRLETQGRTLGGRTLIFQVDDSGSQWWSVGLTRADAWETFHKLETIIKPRSIGLVRARWATYLFVLAAAPAAVLFSAKLGPKHPFVALAFPMLGFFVVGWLLFGVRRPRSAVILRHYHDQAARREERNSKLLFAVLGVVLGVVGTLLSQYLSRLIWPSH